MDHPKEQRHDGEPERAQGSGEPSVPYRPFDPGRERAPVQRTPPSRVRTSAPSTRRDEPDRRGERPPSQRPAREPSHGRPPAPHGDDAASIAARVWPGPACSPPSRSGSAGTRSPRAWAATASSAAEPLGLRRRQRRLPPSGLGQGGARAVHPGGGAAPPDVAVPHPRRHPAGVALQPAGRVARRRAGPDAAHAGHRPPRRDREPVRPAREHPRRHEVPELDAAAVQGQHGHGPRRLQRGPDRGGAPSRRACRTARRRATCARSRSWCRTRTRSSRSPRRPRSARLRCAAARRAQGGDVAQGRRQPQGERPEGQREEPTGGAEGQRADGQEAARGAPAVSPGPLRSRRPACGRP